MRIQIDIKGRQIGFDTQGGFWYESGRRGFYWEIGKRPVYGRVPSAVEA